MYLKKLKIGNVELENNIILAPMAGITDLPFRVMCKEFGCGLVCTEMASSKAIFYNDNKTKKLLNIEGEKRPISVQIFGSDLEALKFAAKYVSEFADIIDINMGCPAPKVVKNGDGSKLLTNLELLEKVVYTVVTNSKVPVTVKIRKGWDSNNIVAIEAAKIIEKQGAAAITVHGRTREQYYSGQVDLDIIKQIKENVSIPVIGNGDIKSGKDAVKMFEYTGVDGIMCGRAALGAPWIFREIIEYLNGNNKEVILPGIEERLNIIKKHIDLEIKEKGEQTAIREMRKHLAWYTKKLKNSSNFRQKVNTLNTKEEVIASLTEYFNSL